MKNFAKFLVVALAVSLIAGMFAFSASAVATEPGANPNELKPGSDRVIFIQDPERDPDTNEIIGELPGDGSGTTPENPLATVEHEGFNGSAEVPKYHLTTSFYQATEMLKETGGTIVVTGPIYFGEYECYGSGRLVRDVFTAEFGNNVIKFTSVWDGVDYRQKNGAKITIETPAMLSILGSSIWENIDFETVGTDRCVSFDEYCTLIGDGVKCYPSDLEIFEGIAPNYISLAAGHRYAKSTGENPTMVVKSGTYNKICGGMWGTVTTAGMEGANTYLTIEGKTEVLGVITGSTGATSPFGGNVNVTINGGVFKCDINGVGPTGLSNTDGNVTIKINGGDFKEVWSINDQDITNTGNAPAFSSVDFSGWTGEELELAYAVAMVTEFTEIKLPEGKTVDGLKALAEAHPPVIVTTEEEPVITLPPVSDDTTKAPEVQDTTKAPEVEDTTKAPEDTTAPAPENDNGGDMTLWIILGAVAVVAVVAVVVVVVMKKKAAK